MCACESLFSVCVHSTSSNIIGITIKTVLRARYTLTRHIRFFGGAFSAGIGRHLSLPWRLKKEKKNSFEETHRGSVKHTYTRAYAQQGITHTHTQPFTHSVCELEKYIYTLPIYLYIYLWLESINCVCSIFYFTRASAPFAAPHTTRHYICLNSKVETTACRRRCYWFYWCVGGSAA